jgi:endonuclease/exonuclease/phosphatase family metal-dependent hydrolase
MSAFRVVTFNLLNRPSRWEQRRALIAQELEALQPDVIALQEVSLPVNSAQWLADRLGGYAVHLCPMTGKYAQRQAIAILSRLPVRGAWSLSLRSQDRVAQAVQVCVGRQPALIVNGHFYWHIIDHDEHLRQAHRLLEWVDALPHDGPTVLCGDFNGTPDYRAIRLLRRRFASAYVARHGREPQYTCPTPLRYHLTPLRHALLRLGNLARNRSLDIWRGVIDYIFVNRRVSVVDCDVVLNRPAPHDHTLYPSDHVGLAAHLALA